MTESTKPRPPRSKPARSPASAFLANAAAVKQQTLTYWRDVISRQPLAKQKEWLSTREALQFMGSAWVRGRLVELERVERRLKDRVPSGAWFEAVWDGEATFPPQDDFCPLAVVAGVYGVAATWRLPVKRAERRLARLLRLVAVGIDPVQLLARRGSRMSLSACRTSFGTSEYADDVPIVMPPANRIMPPQCVGESVPGSEDWFDKLTPLQAVYARDPRSCSAATIVRIGELRGRDDSEDRRERRRARKKERLAIAAAKARAALALKRSAAA